MALTLEPTESEATEPSIDLAEYLASVSASVDLRDRASVLESAGLLRSLARNRSVVADRFNADVSAALDGAGPESLVDYVSTSYLLARGPGFVVRANLWLPPAGFSRQRESIQALGSYQQPHDHDFSFLTVGYWGSGYATAIYEYEPERMTGRVGDRLDITFLEKTTLPVGKVMYYRASRDIHTQEFPVEPSISLNLLLVPDVPRPQYLFDLAASRVAGVVANGAEDAIGLCQLARWVGDARTADHLERIAAVHPCPQTRRAAYDSLWQLQPDAAPALLRRALSDPADLVSATARRVLEAGGG